MWADNLTKMGKEKGRERKVVRVSERGREREEGRNA